MNSVGRQGVTGSSLDPKEYQEVLKVPSDLDYKASRPRKLFELKRW